MAREKVRTTNLKFAYNFYRWFICDQWPFQQTSFLIEISDAYYNRFRVCFHEQALSSLMMSPYKFASNDK